MPGIGLTLAIYVPRLIGAGGPPPAPSFMLLEDGFYLLLESGDHLIL